MLKDTSNICFGDEHSLYLFTGFAGLIIYYPISTFMYPVLNCESRGKTWKYEASYIVLYIQSKLLQASILGVNLNLRI